MANDQRSLTQLIALHVRNGDWLIVAHLRSLVVAS